MSIDPPHRRRAAEVYDAIRRNATSARAARKGSRAASTGAAGGIPFPIPREGAEAMLEP